MFNKLLSHGRSGYVSRRDFLFRAGEGISGLALAHLLNQDGLLGAGCENAPGITPLS